MGRVRVFIACSLDGFIAGPDGDLSWLPQPGPDDGDFGYGAFLADVGALCVGRATFDVAAGFPEWPYGERPVLVATHRPLPEAPGTVRAVSGDVGAMLDEALAAAAGRDVYLDGGAVIRQALDRGRVDELTVSVVPVVLGVGAPLFVGLAEKQPLALVRHRVYPGGLVQLSYRPAR